jgi:predicted dehydrogenase
MALTNKIVSAVRRTGLLTCAGYMNRYRPGVQMVKKALARDPAILVTGGWIGGTPRPRGGKGIWTWWVDKKKSGGQFHEQVTHTVDLARFLCDEVKEVHAFAAEGFNIGTPRNYDIEDAAVVNIRFQCGAVANLWAGCCANGGGGGISLSIYAARTTALFTGWEHSVRLLREKKDPVEIAGAGAAEIFAVEDDAFIKAVRTGKRAGILSSYEDAAKTLAVTLAANESMRTGKPVPVRV